MVRCGRVSPCHRPGRSVLRSRTVKAPAISQMRQQIKSNPASVLRLYNTVSDYVLTDLVLCYIVYLVTEAASMGFSGYIFCVPIGEGIVSV